MPNWENNMLYVTGSEEVINAVYKKAFVEEPNGKGGVCVGFSLNKFLPMPAEYQDMPNYNGFAANDFDDSVGSGIRKLVAECYKVNPNIEEDKVFSYVRNNLVNVGVEVSPELMESDSDHIEPLWVFRIKNPLDRFVALELCDLKYGEKDWYDWSLKNWGCKWDAGIEGTSYFKMGESKQGVFYLDTSFDTPWVPPKTAIEKLAEMFPKAEIAHSYIGESMFSDPCGRDVYRDGVCKESWEAVDEASVLDFAYQTMNTIGDDEYQELLQELREESKESKKAKEGEYER